MDFEKEFDISLPNKLLKIKKECKKLDVYLISLQNMLDLQVIDNQPLI